MSHRYYYSVVGSCWDSLSVDRLVLTGQRQTDLWKFLPSHSLQQHWAVLMNYFVLGKLSSLLVNYWEVCMAPSSVVGCMWCNLNIDNNGVKQCCRYDIIMYPFEKYSFFWSIKVKSFCPHSPNMSHSIPWLSAHPLASHRPSIQLRMVLPHGMIIPSSVLKLQDSVGQGQKYT